MREANQVFLSIVRLVEHAAHAPGMEHLVQIAVRRAARQLGSRNCGSPILRGDPERQVFPGGDRHVDRRQFLFAAEQRVHLAAVCLAHVEVEHLDPRRGEAMHRGQLETEQPQHERILRVEWQIAAHDRRGEALQRVSLTVDLRRKACDVPAQELGRPAPG